MDLPDIEVLQRELTEHADPKVKNWWQGYVKGGAPFLGVKMAIIRSVLHKWYKQHITDTLDSDQQKDVAVALLHKRHTEEKLAGILFLQEILIPSGVVQCEQDLKHFADLFINEQIYDWNICDWFCVKVLGPLIKNQGKSCAEAVSAWRTADNLWQARSSVVAFVPVADHIAYHPLVRKSCVQLIRREERFAKTGVGWILREISKYNQQFVTEFIEEHVEWFSLESLRNATKYFGKEMRTSYTQILAKER